MDMNPKDEMMHSSYQAPTPESTSLFNAALAGSAL